jgi:hypothetical protein
MEMKVTSKITFAWANNVTFTIKADETAREAIQTLKKYIDSWGAPVLIETGTLCQVQNKPTNIGN